MQVALDLLACAIFARRRAVLRLAHVTDEVSDLGGETLVLQGHRRVGHDRIDERVLSPKGLIVDKRCHEPRAVMDLGYATASAGDGSPAGRPSAAAQ